MIKAFVVLCLAVAVANAGLSAGIVGPSAPGVVLHGPSAKGSVVGPDGSHIHAVLPGATVIAHPKHGGVVTGSVVPGHVSHHGGWGGGHYAHVWGPVHHW